MILSDVLPYETPVSFSSKGLYKFLINHRISLQNNVIQWKALNKELDALVAIIFGIEISKAQRAPCKDGYKEITISPKNLITIPFNYFIKHKHGELRQLTVIHPRNQIAAASFYEKFKELIVYNSALSEFSLRRPARIAKSIYWDDKKRLKPLESSIEVSDGEESNLKSFFVYKNISNIFKFFESQEYHRCEKIYNHMAKLDVAKCFDSIYTHSIAWALYGKDAVKNVLSDTFPKCVSLKGSFGQEFDELIQQSNYQETNGIPIGPEISRVFSEIIFQRIDDDVLKELKDTGIDWKIDYEIFRYMDDYFVFYNDAEKYEKIINAISVSLKNYKLSLSSEKSKIYNKPIITEITIAKKYISDMIDEKVAYQIEDAGLDSEGKKIVKGKIYINKSSLITSFKTILKVSGVEYDGALNYTFAILETRIQKILNDYRRIVKASSSTRQLAHALSSIVEFMFFIYASSPKVNTTVKLSRVLYIIIQFSREKELDLDDSHAIFNQIYENITFILRKESVTNYAQVETLYLLTILTCLGRYYRLSEDELARFLNINRESASGDFRAKGRLNYFVITTALFFMQNLSRYESLRKFIEKYSIDMIEQELATSSKNAECTFLYLDLLSCPYISREGKTRLIELWGVQGRVKQVDFLDLNNYWFTKWVDFDLAEELDRKRSLEVY
ncbi:antiviral reverse transcriptase Drt3b [Halomonas denitrificans]|uniref:antiviral reverse transcriptase Drt3b n=1 Tax=Halomonas denitrificans TaxID=370769 RepID=UPI001C98FD8A|nr:antiviral reverse transcriptase Drt3b [Halomonas denitrificans]MBY5968370.1 RNA-directed DNA polymerase [Halomonas denitrificans]